MFTGIITDVGSVTRVKQLNDGLQLRISTAYNTAEIASGASIACSGVCLTVTGTSSLSSSNLRMVTASKNDNNDNWFEVEAWHEALQLTTINQWKTGQRINLERSLKLGDEMGGHLVSGHVDGKAQIENILREGDATRFQLIAPRSLAKFIARKGSVALDGTSLTVNNVAENRFDVLIIRHTLEVTTWNERRIGDEVNIEIDQLARYAARLSSFGENKIKASSSRYST